jgi:hypothetical protein
MTESMIERVARRLFWQHDGKYAERGMPTWTSLDEATRNGFIKDARAAIDEMREPTDDMKHAPVAQDGDWSDERDLIWKGMIDAALSERAQCDS